MGFDMSLIISRWYNAHEGNPACSLIVIQWNTTWARCVLFQRKYGLHCARYISIRWANMSEYPVPPQLNFIIFFMFYIWLVYGNWNSTFYKVVPAIFFGRFCDAKSWKTWKYTFLSISSKRMVQIKPIRCQTVQNKITFQLV